MEDSIPTPTNSPKTANAFIAVSSLLVYCYFFGTFMAWFGFLLPREHLPPVIANILPYSINTAESNPEPFLGALIDFLLLISFAIPHSFLARSWVKEMIGLPKSLERSFFVLQATIFMHAYMHCWQDYYGPDVAIWKVAPGSVSSYIILATFLFGMLFLLSASFALDHFHLFGLTQGFGVDLNKMVGLAVSKQPMGELVVHWHYTVVAHPIMTGMLIVLWATPVMTVPRLELAIVNTLYILLAVIQLEEPSVEKEIGTKYRDYLLSVPRFIPGLYLSVRASLRMKKEV